MPVSRFALAALGGVFVTSRILYGWLGVRFNGSPIGFYLQYVDPDLLRNALWQSLFYLKEQPPGWNAFLGAVLKLFPNHTDAAFQAAYLIWGFATACALFVLLDRLGARPAVAVAVAVAFAVSPVTVLYENWLFYAYAITGLLVFAALFLHRYVTSRRGLDGGAFFMCLTLLGTIRTVYHPAWFAATALLLLWAMPCCRRTTAKAAAIPAALLGAIYLKHFLLFGGFVIGGEVFQPANLVLMATAGLPPSSIESLETEGVISPILRRSAYGGDPAGYSDLVPKPAATGIPLLDDLNKSTGAGNWNSLWMGKVGALYRKDALVVLRAHPEAYARSVFRNLAPYFKAPNWGWPFDGQTPSRSPGLDRLLGAFSALTTGTSKSSGLPWLSFLWVPGLLGFGLWVSGQRLARRTGDPGGTPDATAAVLLFAVFNIAYSAVVTIVFSAGDHNRYRDEVSGLFALLLGLAVSKAWESAGRARTPITKPNTR